MAIQITTWLLIFAFFYLIATSIVFIRNRFDLGPLYQQKPISYHPTISVCIPARNEENTLDTLLHSLESQNWDSFDVHVLDDQSSDNTYTIAESYHKSNPTRFFAHSGDKKPEDWLGKPWACHQLSQKSDGDIIVFLDADTKVQPNFFKQIAASFEHYQLDMLTVWPKQKVVTFWEQTVIPLIYYSLLTVLPAVYVYRDPKWLPSAFRSAFRSKFAAACGQCMAFKKPVYESIGGHVSVKNQIVEDVELAKIIKKKGYVMRMFTGLGSISCRMYRNRKEIFEGLRKNFLAGFNNSLPLFIAASILHLIVFVLPFVTFIISVFLFYPKTFFLSVAAISLILIQRLILATWYKFNPVYAFTHPLGVLWFQFLFIIKIWDHLTRKPPIWKGRKL